MSAPVGNKNALRNGSRVDRRRLVVGELPKSMIAVKREARAFRRYLESETKAAKGTIDAEDENLIIAATACTMSAGLNRWLLRNRKDLGVADIRGCAKEIRDSLRERARLVKELGLRQPPPSPWAVLDAEVKGKADD